MPSLFVRTFLLILAIFLILTGLIVLPLPIPFGALMIVMGVSILISTNDKAADWIRRYRVRHPKLNERLLGLERRLPERLARIVRRTSPLI